MRKSVAVAAAAVLAACGSQEPASGDAQQAPGATPEPAAAVAASAVARTPDLAACPQREAVDEGMRQRTEAIPVPKALRESMRSDMDNFAISTLDGATVCVDASWVETIHDA